jgi:hypothetical protein
VNPPSLSPLVPPELVIHKEIVILNKIVILTLSIAEGEGPAFRS